MKKGNTIIEKSVFYFVPASKMSVAVFYHLIKPALLDKFVFVSKEDRPDSLRNKNLIIDLSVVDDYCFTRQILLTHRSLENNVVVLGKIKNINSLIRQIAAFFFLI